MNWAGQTVLVTGAGGFIGSHLVERLVALGARTRAFVHYNANGAWGWLDSSPVREGVEVFLGDVRDPDSLRPAVKGADVIFHLAALIGIPYSYVAPTAYIRTNVEGTLNVLQAARDLGVGKVVHTSTSEVYGTAAYVPIDEAHPLRGQSPYSASKIGADKITEAFHLSFDLPVVTVRPFNTYGPRQSARALIPTIISQALAGDIVRLGSLHPTRDLNFVTDTAEGFVKAAAAPEASGRTVQIGSGQEVSAGSLVEEIGGLLGRKLQVVTDAQRVRPKDSEVERLLCDNRLARSLLGWAPQVPREEGLRRTVEWIRQHHDQYRTGVYAV